MSHPIGLAIDLIEVWQAARADMPNSLQQPLAKLVYRRGKEPMFYREAGQFKTSYVADSQILPLRQDRIAMTLLLLAAIGIGIAAIINPAWISAYFFSAILIPFLIFSLAALGLNILTGYAGQISLGSAAFMAIGAFASFNFILRIPGIPVLVAFALGGISAAVVGIMFGLPSLRVRGFYLAAATLATQFFVIWCLTKVPYFTDGSTSGVITAQSMVILGMPIDTHAKKYLLTLFVVVVMTLLAKNMVRSNVGRSWMAVRDMDVAAEVIGFRPVRTKLLAFAVSSFYCGVAGALYAYAYLGTVEPEAYNLDLSFRILFMVIIGGAGSILGSYLGAAFIVLLPIMLNIFAGVFKWCGDFATEYGMVIAAKFFGVISKSASNLELMVFGALIIFFLIVEPHGLARLWQISKEKLRLWPFPH